MTILNQIIPAAQFKLIETLRKGEEGEFFDQKFAELEAIFENMPSTYETDGQGASAVAHLHYFCGDSHWYIVEKDCGDEQFQAYGLAILNGDLDCAEMGYISLLELIRQVRGVEIDLHWTPKTLADVRKELNARYGD